MGEHPRPDGSSAADSAAGTLSRLLLELARAPEEDPSAPPSLEPGQRVGRYEIRRAIGRGGFGTVYEAHDPELGRAVALKTLRPGRSRRDLSEDWIKQEAEAIARLDHPSIVTVHDVGRCDAGPYLVEELLHGETLAERIARGPLPADEALRVGEEMARGLAHAHHRGVLHRDLKPANVFLCEDGRVKLLDFGLAHLLGREGSSGGGTPAYMAPEQAGSGTVDERADVYAAAVILGETIAGRRPVGPVTPPAGLSATVPVPPPDLAGVPRAVARALTPALSADPASRPRDGAAWLESLRRTRRSLERPRSVRRVALLGSAFLVLGLLVAGVATWRVWERQVPGGRPTVAVADFTNETGERELDGISGLLITSLEQGTQLRVLTRGRMLDVLRQLGKGDVPRVDETLAREVGREARVRAILLASVRRLGEGYLVEMRALDPLHDEYLFTVSDKASGKAEVFDLVDRLGEATRRRLGTAGPGSGAVPRVASITTGNVKAWELVFRARQAFDAGRLEEARDLSAAALREDPEFPLAHYQLALLAWWGDQLTPHGIKGAHGFIRAAERHADRLPEKERTFLAGMRAVVDGRWDAATRLFDQMAEAHPLDKEALLYGANVRMLRDDLDGSISILDRALQLDPQYRPALLALLETLMWSGRGSERIAWMRVVASSTTDGDLLHDLALAMLSTGAEEEAVAVLRMLLAGTGTPWPPMVYARYLTATRRAAEAEAGIRGRLAALPSSPSGEQVGPVPPLKDHLALALVAQGRQREADLLLREIARSPRELLVQHLRLAAAARSPDGLRRSGEELLQREGAGVHPSLPQFLALGGDVTDAGLLTRRSRGDPFWDQLSPGELLMAEGIEAWGDGSLEAAADRFRRCGASSALMTRYLCLALLGELSRARGDCPTAVEALERALAIRWTRHLEKKAWFDPGLLHSLALCHERTGDLPRARERNDEMLGLWARADPDLPLLAEAKALQARLSGGPGAGR